MRNTIYGLVIVFILFIFSYTRCSMFGGSEISPAAKIAQKTAQALKKVEEVEKNYGDISGTITELKTEITTFKTEITNKIDQSTTNNNESLKSLAWTAAGIYILIEFLKFARALIIAKIEPGNTVMNLIKGKKDGKQ